MAESAAEFLWGIVPLYDECGQSWCQILALDNIIERFYDFQLIYLKNAIFLTFIHVDVFEM
jgi:hypothetical protein